MAAVGSQRYLAYVKEIEAGTVPVTPTFQKLRTTGGSGVANQRSPLQSNEIRSDRQISVFRLGNNQSQVQIPFELSYGSFDDLLESALFGTWADNVLKAGTIKNYFSFEEGFTDVGVYMVVTGNLCNQFQLSIQPGDTGAIITGSMDFVGMQALNPDYESAAASILDESTTDVFDTFEGFVKQDHDEIAVISGLSLTLANGVNPRYALFQGKNAVGLRDGRSTLTGDVNLFFESSDQYENFLNETEMRFEFRMEDPSGNAYEILLPRVKYTGESRNVTENDVVETMPIQALYDESTGSQIQITRVAA